MEQTKLISVIVPVYNVESYLRECVESVLGQSYPHFELLLVDDGSTDRSGEICDEYAAKDNRVKVIHQKNGGQAAARNAGLALVAGDYVYFLDSDDWIEADALELLLRTAEETAADLVFFDAISFDDDTGKESERQSYLRKNDYPAGPGREVFAALQEKKEFSMAVPLTFLRREYLTRNRLAYVPGITMEDVLFSFQLFCLAEKAAQLRKALYHRRYRAGSVTKSARTVKHFKSGCVLLRELCAFVKSAGLEGRPSERYLARCAYNTLNMYDELPSTDKKSEKKSREELVALIKAENAFGERPLRARCHGKLLWAAAKGLEKIGI